MVGCGAMGSATCSHLARRGVSVIGIERFGRGHKNGSHTGYTRATREAYEEGHEYVPLVQEANR